MALQSTETPVGGCVYLHVNAPGQSVEPFGPAFDGFYVLHVSIGTSVEHPLNLDFHFLSDRPNFEGDKDSPGGGRRRSPVTNTFETYFPDSKRKV